MDERDLRRRSEKCRLDPSDQPDASQVSGTGRAPGKLSVQRRMRPVVTSISRESLRNCLEDACTGSCAGGASIAMLESREGRSEGVGAT